MFELTLTNGATDLLLKFKVRDTVIARKWFAELSNKYKLDEVDRFSNWGKQSFISQLNAQIAIINKYQFKIDKTVSDKPTQDDLNYLHKFFEDLRGEVTEGTDWYNSAPKRVQQAVNKFNILIHQLESAIRTGNKYPTLVVTFKDRPRIELTDDDLKHFTYLWGSGTVYVNYCQVGKTVLDAYTDNDTIAEAIRPQTHYSADFLIKFGPATNPIYHWFRSLWIKYWLFRRKFKFNNLNLGMIPVADLQTVVSKDTLLKYNKVKKVKCIK
jgi:hypothetical protein